VAEARAALDVLPTYADGAELLARALRAAKQYGEAVEVLVDVLAGDPYHLDALVLLGEVLLDEGRRADARMAFLRVLKFDADRAEAHFHLGVAAAAERRFREAIEHWRRAVECDADGALAEAARDNIATALDLSPH
jgi:tetratricopeptide (TPR) repeat protein